MMKPGLMSGFFHDQLMDPSILEQKEPFRQAVIDNLGPLPIDFAEKLDFIHSTRHTPEPYSAAGVLLLLHFREDTAPRRSGQGEYFFQLIKRSARVSQPGDLSCPGGMLAPLLDAVLRPVIACGLIPVVGGTAKAYIRQRPADTIDTLMLLLTSAVRESWEEVRLSPFNIEFLGPLPCHSLILFRRMIFPMVVMVKNTPSYRPNHEVERIVEIPVRAFFQNENYARYQIRAEDSVRRGDQASWEFPCFIQHEGKNGQDVLWGATFHIILRFLEILFDFVLPDIRSNPIISRTLRQSYLTGNK
jgi:8-oxo-dGTP pyrophosphatase MutT (NUDIX family)